MLYDTHLHTEFSTDSEMKFKELKDWVQNYGQGVIVTEHMDLKYPKPNQFVFSPSDYFTKFGPYRSKQILLGIEIGLRLDCLEEFRQMIKDYPFDFVLGSIHVVDQKDLYYNPFYEGRSKKEAYERYFQAMWECLSAFDCIDSLGHIDYIARYAPYSDPEIHYSEFPELIDEVLRLVAKKDIALEINTRRFTEQETVQQLMPIYQRFREVGGRYVTLGSDAHRISEVGRALEEADALAKACDLTVVHFVNRQRIEA
ncbi:MAG: histidinol phosphate phosphatase [Sporomusaceae bacterium]|nr:histidinol phosphate phosphatase [Sporomusaceae bacterium]